MNMTAEAERTELNSTSGSIFQRSSLWTKRATMKAYTAATAPPSVGVKMPMRMPTMMMTGIIMAGMAARVVGRIWSRAIFFLWV